MFPVAPNLLQVLESQSSPGNHDRNMPLVKHPNTRSRVAVTGLEGPKLLPADGSSSGLPAEFPKLMLRSLVFAYQDHVPRKVRRA